MGVAITALSRAAPDGHTVQSFRELRVCPGASVESGPASSGTVVIRGDRPAGLGSVDCVDDPIPEGSVPFECTECGIQVPGLHRCLTQLVDAFALDWVCRIPPDGASVLDQFHSRVDFRPFELSPRRPGIFRTYGRQSSATRSSGQYDLSATHRGVVSGRSPPPCRWQR